ncbi:TIGR00659 family protein [Geoalkalibacter ferrihydriticus]|uniref:Membrane protein n=2 Tax=Geoalkalibacter ferrihydriticus TaxID=392333 RepID=A0A0C2EDU8_9BACT|nr:LrgB family protein [Geoalkalibacter ferrihydriticus]KIH76753.1 membrane protein [Geoalkalibacter ferrihydriticus DSM 17813]SDL53430.1 TIGR00659 family protein [Geoalkalibacter ferrihydriticus]
MIDDLLFSPLFGVGLTLAVYALAQKIYQRAASVFFNPVALSILAIVGFLLLFRIPYDAYAQGGRYILFLLGPSVVALAVPLYTRRQEILAKKAPILLGVTAGAVVSIVSVCGLAWLLGGSRELILSLSPKSVTAPIAIGIVEKIGGLPPLTAALVVLTGCLGAICGPEFCRLIGVRDPAAMGLAVGTASHGIGTARMLEVDRLGGAVSGLAIGLNGLITAFILPFIVVLFI